MPPSLTAAASRNTLDLIESGMAPVVVGTHGGDGSLGSGTTLYRGSAGSSGDDLLTLKINELTRS